MKNGLFRKDEFRYDAARDVYVCPAGEALSRNHESTLRGICRKFRVRAITMEKKETSYGEKTEATGYFRRAA